MTATALPALGVVRGRIRVSTPASVARDSIRLSRSRNTALALAVLVLLPLAAVGGQPDPKTIEARKAARKNCVGGPRRHSLGDLGCARRCGSGSCRDA